MRDAILTVNEKEFILKARCRWRYAALLRRSAGG
jgi:hypothetical protein